MSALIYYTGPSEGVPCAVLFVAFLPFILWDKFIFIEKYHCIKKTGWKLGHNLKKPLPLLTQKKPVYHDQL